MQQPRNQTFLAQQAQLKWVGLANLGQLDCVGLNTKNSYGVTGVAEMGSIGTWGKWITAN